MSNRPHGRGSHYCFALFAVRRSTQFRSGAAASAFLEALLFIHLQYTREKMPDTPCDECGQYNTEHNQRGRANKERNEIVVIGRPEIIIVLYGSKASAISSASSLGSVRHLRSSIQAKNNESLLTLNFRIISPTFLSPAHI